MKDLAEKKQNVVETMQKVKRGSVFLFLFSHLTVARALIPDVIHGLEDELDLPHSDTEFKPIPKPVVLAAPSSPPSTGLKRAQTEAPRSPGSTPVPSITHPADSPASPKLGNVATQLLNSPSQQRRGSKSIKSNPRVRGVSVNAEVDTEYKPVASAEQVQALPPPPEPTTVEPVDMSNVQRFHQRSKSARPSPLTRTKTRAMILQSPVFDSLPVTLKIFADHTIVRTHFFSKCLLLVSLTE